MKPSPAALRAAERILELMEITAIDRAALPALRDPTHIAALIDEEFSGIVLPYL